MSRTGRGSVDENLFGQPSRKTLHASVPSNAVVVSSAEIASIRQRSVLKSPADEMRERAAREAALEEKQQISRARKEKMIQMELEAKNKVSQFLYCHRIESN